MQNALKRNYAGLDLIRFFAAALVMIYHLSYWDWVQPGVVNGIPYRNAFSPMFPITSAAWVGVPIFFVLSGFVISLSATGRKPSSFAISRILRLYPAAWVCGLILGILAMYNGDSSDLLGRIIRSISLWPLGPWLSGVYWTLAIEIVFYSTFFLGMVINSHNVGIRIAWILTLSNIAYLVLRIADRLTGGHFSGMLNFFQSPAGSLFLLSRGCYFAFGIALWAHSIQGWTRSVVALTICSAGTSSVFLFLEDFYLVQTSDLPRWWAFSPLALWGLATAVLIYATSANNIFTKVSPILRAAIRVMGLMTYPLYLLHANLGNAIMLALSGLSPFLALLAATLLLFAACFMVVRAEAVIRRGLAHIMSVNRRFNIRVSQLP